MTKNQIIEELRKFLPIPDLESAKSALCVQPHPDDNEVGAGATIAKLASQGCEITYLTVTDGRLGTKDPRKNPRVLAAERKREVLKSASILGVGDIIFLDHSDNAPCTTEELCLELTGIIRKVRPEVVFTVDPHLPYEVHPDHILVGTAVSRACYFSEYPHAYKTTEEEESLSEWRVRAIAYYFTSAPNTFVNVAKTWHLKEEAIRAHQSQFTSEYLDLVLAYLRLVSGNEPGHAGSSPAEHFKVLSPIHLHCVAEAQHL